MTTEPLHDGRFARIERMLGRQRLARLMNSFVTIVGLGAVGSYAAEALARAGVGHLRLVDFDEVRLSNINRQLFALSSTVGQKKCQIARQRILDINPNCQIEAMETFVHEDTVDAVLAGPPDLVIDAIDSFTPKQILLQAIHRKGLCVISSMGAALRSDPLAIRVGPMSSTRNCPLAAKLRKALRQRGVPLDFTCVYSVELVQDLPPDAIDVAATENEDIVSRGRTRRTLASLPTLTGIFGLIAANTAIQQLVGPPAPTKPILTRPAVNLEC